VDGDDALLRLARLRFAEQGMPAELYAGSPDGLEHELHFVPEHAALPTVHLDRRLNLLDPAARATVGEYVRRFDGRVLGFVVHDQRSMAGRTDEVVAALAETGGRGQGPRVWLEYAAGHPLDWFAEVAARSAGTAGAGVCLDVGHAGHYVVRQALRTAGVPGPLHEPEVLAAHVDAVQDAVGHALPAVLGLIGDLGASGTNVHVHLHDGHPAVRGLADHFGFLFRPAVDLEYRGARSLDPLYGPRGLAALLGSLVAAVPADRLSLTLEVHQAEGRRPLEARARAWFGHWRDLTNAERLNHWLAVVAENHVLATTLPAGLPPGPAPETLTA
jgi:hypothetical protein